MHLHPPALARRQFLRRSLAGVIVGGCGQIGGRAEQTSASPTLQPEQPMAAARPTPLPIAPAPAAATAPACGLTEPNIEGPFYRPGAPSCSELSRPGHGVLASPYAMGTPVTITGRILDRDCRPLPGARVEIWHADHGGAYDHEGFSYRGRLDSGPEGEYRLDTIIPGHYLNGSTYRPAHIHVKVRAPERPLLTTQLYFEGDPHNDGDPFIRESLIMTLSPGPHGGKQATFDFVV
jgi:protocatechuate 3,4-dioxygenase beta subunit